MSDDIDVEVAGAGDVRLAGSARLAEGATWAALLLSGSGPLDRNSEVPDQPLGVSLALAEVLDAWGISSLRYDKRGVGGSSGDYLRTSFDEETADAEAALGRLTEVAGVPRDRVVVIGHSVGATIATRLAAAAPVGGVVLLSMAAAPGLAVMEWQTRQIARSFPGVQRLLAGRFERRQARDREALMASTEDVMELSEVPMPARWMREYMVFDPAPTLAAVECPVLAITGGCDIQVDPADVARIGELVKGPFTGETPDPLTHLLRNDRGRIGLNRYSSQLTKPVDLDLLQRIADWVGSLDDRQPDPEPRLADEETS